MSKGTVTGGEDGLYSVTIEKEDGDTETMDAYCCDLTEDLSGDVGVLEIAGDIDKGINVQPGAIAAYDPARDGKMSVVLRANGEQPASGTYWNLAMRPGWQKWRPNYRYGTITAIDTGADTCDVTLDECLSTDRPDGNAMDLNQSESLSDVPIEYMSCDSGAFEVGDEVVVKFEGNDWESPKVIGFKKEPKGCYWEDWSSPELCAKHNWELRDRSVSEDDALCPELPYGNWSIVDNLLIGSAPTNVRLGVEWLVDNNPDDRYPDMSGSPKMKIRFYAEATEPNYVDMFLATTTGGYVSVTFLLAGNDITISKDIDLRPYNDGTEVEIDLSGYGLDGPLALLFVGLTPGTGPCSFSLDYITFNQYIE